MKHLLPRLGAAAFALAAVSPVAANPFEETAVAHEALETMRGGFALPGGLDVSIAVQSDTAVNGALVLRTQFLASSGSPTLTVFGRTDASAASTAAPVSSGRTVTVGVQPAALGAPAGLTQLNLAPGGVQAVTEGTVSLAAGDGPANRVTYSQHGLDVTHLTGQAFGAVAANSLDSVSIDTATIVNIDIRGATVLNMGSSMARIDTLALDAAARLSR